MLPLPACSTKQYAHERSFLGAGRAVLSLEDAHRGRAATRSDARMVSSQHSTRQGREGPNGQRPRGARPTARRCQAARPLHQTRRNPTNGQPAARRAGPFPVAPSQPAPPTASRNLPGRAARGGPSPACAPARLYKTLVPPQRPSPPPSSSSQPVACAHLSTLLLLHTLVERSPRPNKNPTR